MVRVIAGEARGRRLSVPPGPRVRPTADRVREAMFNVLVHRLEVELPGARVLDLFAGAGTLGLEALSRGAAEVVLVEGDRRVATVLRRNAAAVAESLAGTATVVVEPVERYLLRPARPFDLVFLDPPYQAGAIAPTLDALGASGWLAEGARIVVEHAARTGLGQVENLETVFARRYGDTGVTILTVE